MLLLYFAEPWKLESQIKSRCDFPNNRRICQMSAKFSLLLSLSKAHQLRTAPPPPARQQDAGRWGAGFPISSSRAHPQWCKTKAANFGIVCTSPFFQDDFHSALPEILNSEEIPNQILSVKFSFFGFSETTTSGDLQIITEHIYWFCSLTNTSLYVFVRFHF